MTSWLRRFTGRWSKVDRKRRTPSRPRVEGLEERCLLAAPVIDPVSNTTGNIPVGKTLIVPITASDSDGDALTYTVASDNAQVQARLHTGNKFLRLTVEGFGAMEFELFDDLTPTTASRIEQLTNTGFYNNLKFHRVVKNFVIQGGDPLGTGSGGTGVKFRDEFVLDSIFSGNGQLAMANSGKDTNDSQFFVTIGPQRLLDFNHTIFGQLVRGFDVLQQINNVPTNPPAPTGGQPVSPVVITKAELVQNKTDAVITLDADPGVTTSATITLTATDSNGETGTRTFVVQTVADSINDPPVLGPVTNQTTTRNTNATFSLTGSDLENDALRFDAAVIDSTPRGTVSVSGNLITVVPEAGFVGSINVIVGVMQVGATGRGSTSSPFDSEVITVSVTDPPPAGSVQFSAAVASVAEPNNSVSLTITRTGGSSGAITVPLTVSGTATSGSDYVALATSLSFANGETSKQITVQAVDDAKVEGSESLVITLGAPTGGASLGSPMSATVTLVDDDKAGTIQFGQAAASLAENAGNATITVTYTGANVGAFSAQFTVSVPNTLKLKEQATPGKDFQGSLSGTVTFNAGETTRTIVLPISNDDLVEVTESFTVTLSAPTQGVALGSQAVTTVSILDDDMPSVADAAPNLPTLQAAGSGFGKSTEHYRDFVSKAYARFLNRQPDDQGFQYWVGLMQQYETSNHQLGLRQEQIEAGFLDSPEYKGRYGGTGEAWIRGIYQDLLGRAADGPGVQYWLAQLSGGVTATQVALGFTASDERLRNRVQDTYRTLLGREADTAGLAYWISIFKSGGTTEDINSGFVGSPEYYGKAGGAAGNPAKWVREAYLDILFRPAAAPELDYWLNFLKT